MRFEQSAQTPTQQRMIVGDQNRHGLHAVPSRTEKRSLELSPMQLSPKLKSDAGSANPGPILLFLDKAATGSGPGSWATLHIVLPNEVRDLGFCGISAKTWIPRFARNDKIAHYPGPELFRARRNTVIESA